MQYHFFILKLKRYYNYLLNLIFLEQNLTYLSIDLSFLLQFSMLIEHIKRSDNKTSYAAFLKKFEYILKQ